MPRELSLRDQDILAAVKAGVSYASVGKIFGISRSRVHQIAAEYGVQSKNRRPLSDQEMAEYVALYHRGIPFNHMSTVRRGSTIATALVRQGIHTRECASERAWTAGDTDVLKKCWGKLSCAEIARKIGTTKNAVIGRAHRLNLPSLKRAPSKEMVDA